MVAEVVRNNSRTFLAELSNSTDCNRHKWNIEILSVALFFTAKQFTLFFTLFFDLINFRVLLFSVLKNMYGPGGPTTFKLKGL